MKCTLTHNYTIYIDCSSSRSLSGSVAVGLIRADVQKKSKYLNTPEPSAQSTLYLAKAYTQTLTISL